MTSSALPFGLVTSERIAIDYVNRASKLKDAFPKHFREPRGRECRVDRAQMTEKLLRYNQRIGASKRVIENVRSLAQDDTYAVITGQQPGLFSGPLYTLYKALSTIILSERLSTRRRPVVPLFWNASEDHDIAEVGHIGLFRENELLDVRYDAETTDVALSRTSLDKAQLLRMLALVDSVSPKSEFKTPLLKRIEAIIQQSSTFGDFFSRFMTYLFGEWGLILAEPQYFRDLMAPVFAQLIQRPTECTQTLNQAGLKLKQLGYSPKIHKRSNLCSFFLLDDEGRRRGVTFSKEFKAGEETFSQRDLLNLLEEDPSRFSANAVTRPLTQDLVFPTFAYVAGPSEIAYLAQLTELYASFSLEMPVVFPRFGATILERKISKILSKYTITLHELRTPEKLLKTLARERFNGVFKSFKSDISKTMTEMARQAESLDESLIKSCALAEGKILKTIDTLESKIAAKLKEQNLVAKRQITKAYNNIFPNGQPQERQVNVLEYLTKFGSEFVNNVYESFLTADYGEHVVIRC